MTSGHSVHKNKQRLCSSNIWKLRNWPKWRVSYMQRPCLPNTLLLHPREITLAIVAHCKILFTSDRWTARCFRWWVRKMIELVRLEIFRWWSGQELQVYSLLTFSSPISEDFCLFLYVPSDRSDFIVFKASAQTLWSLGKSRKDRNPHELVRKRLTRLSNFPVCNACGDKGTRI